MYLALYVCLQYVECAVRGLLCTHHWQHTAHTTQTPVNAER